MVGVFYAGKDYSVRTGESLLDALIRQGADVSFSCRSGTCQVCMLVSPDHGVSPAAQKGLPDELREKGYLLPCKCYPESFLSLQRPNPHDISFKGILAERTRLSEDVYSIKIEPFVTTSYVPGQFFNLYRGEAARSYSVSSVADEDCYLEFHVKHHPDGLVSPWLCLGLQTGDEILLSGPFGDAVYKPAVDAGRDLLLVATGTGLSSSIGVLKDALFRCHDGSITLMHGARKAGDLYLHDYLVDLASKNSRFRYIPCLTEEDLPNTYRGRVTDEGLFTGFDARNKTVFMAGSDAMVLQASQFFYSLGAEDGFVRKDAHGFAGCASDGSEPEVSASESGYPDPIPELWAALMQDNLLGKILDEFYDIVFEDPVLSPYFHNVTKQRVKEKVYSFYRRIFSGDQVYFGDRPRNAHHWMVISDEIFNYRENLLLTVIRKHGLDECLISKWKAAEDYYRGDIVKSAPRGRVVDGIEGPSGGFAKELLAIGAVCDSCEAFIPENTEVMYHLRTGQIYCSDCSGEARAHSS